MQGVLFHELLEFGAQGGVPAERQLRPDPLLDGAKTEHFEPLNLRPGKPLELQIGQRPAAPQRLRLAQQHRGPARITLLERVSAIGHPPLEGVQIQFAVLDAEQVPGRPGEQPGLGVTVGERLAQARDLNPEHPVRRTRRLVR